MLKFLQSCQAGYVKGTNNKTYCENPARGDFSIKLNEKYKFSNKFFENPVKIFLNVSVVAQLCNRDKLGGPWPKEGWVTLTIKHRVFKDIKLLILRHRRLQEF